MNGTGNGSFSPSGTITVAEVATIAARLLEATTGQTIPGVPPLPGETPPWYQQYVGYLTSNGVAVPDPTENATRQEFFNLLSAVTAPEQLPAINAITSLPDAGDATVLAFYNAGILTGTDQWGTFAGDRSLTRAECAAMVSRLVRPELRLTFSPADYGPFTAASMEPGDILFQSQAGAVTAGDYLPYVVARIGELETVCTEEGVEFNWFHTWGEETFLDYVKNDALTHFGVTRREGTDLYQNFDLQVFYSRLLDLRGAETSVSL